jgi:hypothetical protein
MKSIGSFERIAIIKRMVSDECIVTIVTFGIIVTIATFENIENIMIIATIENIEAIVTIKIVTITANIMIIEVKVSLAIVEETQKGCKGITTVEFIACNENAKVIEVMPRTSIEIRQPFK